MPAYSEIKVKGLETYVLDNKIARFATPQVTKYINICK